MAPPRQSSSAPPSPASLYDIFVDERRWQHTTTQNARYYRDVLRSFYEKHNPALAPKADAIAREWRGRESTLFALLRYKYASQARASHYAPPTVPASGLPSSHAEEDRVSIASADGFSSRRATNFFRSRAAVAKDRRSFGSDASSSSSSSRPRRVSTNDQRTSKLTEMQSEIAKLKSDVEAATKANERAKARACAAQRDARTARLALDEDRRNADKLRAESAALRAERDEGASELKRLKEQLLESSRRDDASRDDASRDDALRDDASRDDSTRDDDGEKEEEEATAVAADDTTAASTTTPAESLEDLAISAVESAVIDVLLTEATIEIDFELSFGPFPSSDDRHGATASSRRHYAPSPIKEEPCDDQDDVPSAPPPPPPAQQLPLFTSAPPTMPPLVVPLGDVTAQ